MRDPKRVTRVGVYGIAIKDSTMLLIRQKKGPFSGKFDFPGGGIEFGETPEKTLRRELMEEVGMEFDSMELVDNLTATIDVPKSNLHESYLFFQIGMIYHLEGFRFLHGDAVHELQPIWIDPRTLLKDQCSSLLWEYLS